MTLEELEVQIRQTLSAGNLIEVEITPEAISSIAKDAYTKAKPWFLEPVFVETLIISSSTDGSYFIPTGNFKYLPDVIEDIYPTAQTGMGSFDNDVAGLLSLEGRHIISQNMVASAYALQFERQADTFLNTTLTFDLIGDKLFVSGAVIDNSVTVVYRPKALSFDTALNEKAVAWMYEYCLAQAKVSVGRARSKFRGGDLELENDGQDLISEGNSSISELIPKLQDLSFV
jgi:hypothetical protein